MTSTLTARRAEFGWWYFHFAVPDGPTLNAVLHQTDIFGIAQRPYFSMTYLPCAGGPLYARRDLAEGSISSQDGLPNCKGGLVSIAGDRLALQLDAGGMRLEAEIQKLAPPLFTNRPLLYSESQDARCSYWIPLIPHGTFEATLAVRSRSMRIQGLAYVDRNWGDLPLQEYVSSWIWGCFADGQIGVVFYRILTQDGRLIDRTAIIREEARTGIAMVSNCLAVLRQVAEPAEFIGTLEVAFPEERVTLSLVLDRARLMRSRVLEEHKGFMATYCRWASEGLLSASSGTRLLGGVAEHIRIAAN